MHKVSQCGKIMLDLLDALEQYAHPALRSKALADNRVVEAREYLGTYKKNLSWIATASEEFIAKTDLGDYYIVNELNNLVSLQFEDYVLAMSKKEDGTIESLKEQAEHDYIFREKRKAV